jgi:prophage tail gpP-like protein
LGVSRVSLQVNGRAYEGWKDVAVTRSIETISAQYSLSISDRFPLQNEPWPIVEGDSCTVQIDGQLVVTGYVDKRDIAYNNQDHSFSVSGRDKTGDLVDCSADLGTFELKKLGRLEIAQKLAAPYGVSVALGSGVTLPPPKDKFALNPGESAFEAIDRLCRECGVLPVSNGSGGIVLSKPGDARAVDSLRSGVNILDARGSFDASSRFQTYKVKAQRRGSDETSGKDAAAVTGSARDDGARAGRTLIVRAESGMTAAEAKTRAEWEAAVRAARAAGVSVTVQGHSQSNGVLWPLNALVRYSDRFMGIDGDMLIAETSFQVSDAGSTTTLGLKYPGAFTPEPVIAKRTQ